MKKIFASTLILIMLSIVSSAYASDILNSGASARQIGLGKAFTAVVGDSSSIFVNPAGISGISTVEATSMFGQLSGEINYNKTGVVIPTGIGVFGIGYASNRAGDLYTTTIEANGRVGLSTSFGYEDSVLLMSYGNTIKKNDERLRYGLNLKYYIKGTGDIVGSKGRGINADLGMDYDMTKKVRAGLVIRNILRGNLGSIIWDNNTNEELPLTASMGLSMKIRDDATANFDLNITENNLIEGNVGLEINLNRNMAVRLGAEEKSLGTAGSYVNLSGGVGLNIKDTVKIDYAYYYDSLLPDNSRSFVSISLCFNSPAKATQK